MRVAYVINQYPKVSHTFIRREIAALRAQGVEVATVAMRGWDEPVVDPADVSERETTHYVLERGVLGLLGAVAWLTLTRPLASLAALGLAISMTRRSLRPLPYHLVYWAEACVVARFARREGCRHLHAHFGTNAAEVAMLAGAIDGVPYSFTVHGPEELDAPVGLGLRTKLERASFVVAISSFGRSQLYRLLPEDAWPKIRVIHCGLDAGSFEAVADDGLDSSRFVCVGRLCEQKGQTLLLEALRRLLDRGHHATLVLAGDGERRAAIEREIERLRLGAHVTITGWISEAGVREALASSRCLVLPSFAEGLPVVLMEAMAARRPVITTYVAGIPELVRDGVDGWLVPAGEVQALADAMERALATPREVLRTMGAAARDRAHARHDVTTEARSLARCFVEVAGTGEERLSLDALAPAPARL
ncbi:MAG: glycosyltransferase [Sandaracinaceae bacterium]|nr:glycosyltransferase [Sandaracinaceae bacterium]